MFFLSCACYALYASVCMCLVAICLERANLSFLVSYCKCVTFSLVFLVRCGT